MHRLLRRAVSRLWVVALAAAGVVLVAPAPEAAAAGHITINWTNRGPGDGFDTIFGANQDLARANIDAALAKWARAIVALNRPSDPSDTTLEVTVNMNPGSSATSCGGSASTNVDGDGYPTGGAINVNGNAGNWFLDPTPFDDSEFSGNIDNPFSGDAQAGSPAAGLCDLETVVVNEGTHVLGITSNAATRFQTGGFNTQLTTTGTTCSGPGDLWQFTGPSITALMTSNNGGTSGSDFGVPVHTAEPCATFGTLSGSNDSGNALFEGSRRYIPSNLDALILKDTYNYEIVMPETFGTFHSVLNQTTGNLLVRGGDDNDTSNDVMSVTRPGEIVSSVDVGNDIPGTGPGDPLVSRYPAGQVQSITLNANDGADSVTMGADLGVPFTANGGTGDDVILTDGGTVNGDGGNDLITGGPSNDTLNGGDGNDEVYGYDGDDTLTGGTGNDKLYAGSGANTVSDGSGDDLVDLTQNAVGVTYATGGGNDTVLGTAFNDSITGSGGTDRLEGRAGNDTLTGGPGSDALYGNDGSDRLVWTNGDGSDVMEGGAGESDLVDVTGAGSGDDFVVQATPGSRVGLQRTNLTPFTLDIGSAEDLRVDGASGPDTVDLRSLTGTDVLAVNVDAGLDGDADAVDVHGTPGGDALTASSPGAGTVDVGGLAYDVTVAGLSSADTVRPVGDAGTDSLVVDAGAGADALGVDLLDTSSADVAGAVPATVGGRTVESLTVDGKGGGDALAVSTPSGADNVTLTPGASADAGSVAAAGLVPLEYRGLGAAGLVELANAGGTRQDALTYRGTGAGDHLGIGAGGVLMLNSQLPVNPSGAASVAADLLAGDDTVDAVATLPYDTSVLGGDSTQGDTVALTGAPGAVGVDLAASSISGYGGTVRVTGVENVRTTQTGAGGSDLAVQGTGADDAISYTPQDAQSGLVTGGPFALTFSGAGGTFSIDPLGGTDRVEVIGGIGGDTFKVFANTTMTAQVGSKKTLAVPQASTELLAFDGNEGSDLFDVTVYSTVSAILAASGDLPSAKKFSDSLTMRDGSGKAQFSDVKSHTPESGSAIASYKNGATTRLDYTSVETVKFVR